MEAQSQRFPHAARHYLGDHQLRRTLAKLQADTRASRRQIPERLPEFEALRDRATEIKTHVLDHLDAYLERFEARVVASGGRVHWCRDAAEARAAILAILRETGARTLLKGKSMVSEEIGLNAYLARNGVEPIETDLGEYIIQLRREAPSHIVMPAIHLDRGQIGATFRDAHQHLDHGRSLAEPGEMLDEARRILRERFLAAEAGLTGANFLIAETGSALIVTNEGNGDLTHTLPKTHIVLAGIEKIVPTLDDAMTFVRILARSATGQEITAYTSLVTGPKRAEDADGPQRFDVVLLDNGRSALLAGRFRPVLRCIRCGACQSVCPVYGEIGGHAYGSVYAGPIGAVLTPALAGLEAAHHLPQASSFCGSCESVCPVRIPLPDLMRHWREAAHQAAISSTVSRLALAAWAIAATRPRLYHLGARLLVAALARLGRKRGRLSVLPFAGGWTAARDLPAPARRTFLDQWRARGGGAP